MYLLTPFTFGTFAAFVLGNPIPEPLQPCSYVTLLVGDGDPHQQGYEIQVTDNLNCGKGGTGCSISQLTSHTVGWSWTFGNGAGGDVQNPLQWISGGFSVDESFTTGESNTCDAKPGETVCVWDSVGHTRYTVRQGQVGNCLHGPDPGHYIIRSPNKDDANRYYCVYGDACRGNGQGYWGKIGRAGGP